MKIYMVPIQGYYANLSDAKMMRMFYVQAE